MKIFNIIAAAGLALGLAACSQQAQELTFVQYNVGVFAKYDSSSVEAVAAAVREMGAVAVTLKWAVGVTIMRQQCRTRAEPMA